LHARDASVIVAVAGFVPHPHAVAVCVAGHVCRDAYVASVDAVRVVDAVRLVHVVHVVHDVHVFMLFIMCMLVDDAVVALTHALADDAAVDALSHVY
jgi:hypothetical protein